MLDELEQSGWGLDIAGRIGVLSLLTLTRVITSGLFLANMILGVPVVAVSTSVVGSLSVCGISAINEAAKSLLEKAYGS